MLTFIVQPKLTHTLTETCRHTRKQQLWQKLLFKQHLANVNMMSRSNLRWHHVAGLDWTTVVSIIKNICLNT